MVWRQSQKFIVHPIDVKVVPTIVSFVPEYQTVAQGEAIKMYFRLRNDSMVILEQANINMTATAVGNG